MSNDTVSVKSQRVVATTGGYYLVWNLPHYKVSKCRSCGASIVWATTTHEKNVPLDLGQTRLNEDGDTEVLTHFATCPHGKQWRKK